MYKHREPDLLFARMALLERLATPAQIQKAMGMLRRIAQAGGTPPSIGEVLIGEKIITEEQSRGLSARLEEANRAITDAQAGLHEVPRRVGRYELLERIGRGGMGAVYRARQLNMDRVVALKVLAPHLTRDSKYIKQFIREARAAGQINHANIVSVHEVGEADGHFFICMEFVEGRTLSRELLARRRIPALEALDQAAQVAEALAAAEKAGIVHRDIKPDNLIRTPKGRIMVTDLGLAKRLADVTSAGQTGWACGTPYYMAPEQARDSRRVDTRSDIYSLGATLYHLTTGKLPFEGDSSVEVLMRAATDRLVPPAILCPEVPQPLSDLIERMMAREPEGRPQTAVALIGEIAGCRREIESAGSGRGPSRRLPRGARGAGAAAGTGPLGLALTAAWSLAALAVAALIVQLVVPSGDRKKTGREGAGGRGAASQPTPPPPPLPEAPSDEEARADSAMRELYGRMSAALAAPEGSRWAGLLAECDAKIGSAGRWRPVLEGIRSDLAARAEAMALGELARRRWLAAEASAWYRPADALAQFDATARLWPGTVAARNALEERARMADRLDLRNAELEAGFAALLAAERFDRAGALLAAVRPPSRAGAAADDWNARAAARLAEAQKAAQAHVAALRQEREALAGRLAAIEKLLAAWDFSGARNQAERAMAPLPVRSQPYRRLDLIATRAEALGRFRERLCERLNSVTPRIVDTRFADKPLGLLVASADETGIKLAAAEGGATTRKAWAELSATERWKLSLAMARQRSEEDLVGLALLAVGLGRHTDAGRYLEEASKFGTDPAKYREELVLLVAGDGEAEAEALEAAARQKLAGGLPAEALADLGALLTRLRRTSWVSERSAVLDRLIESAERDCAAAGLFAARSRELPPGCFRLDYDFAKPAAASDWQQFEAGGDRPARLVWLREFTGEFLVRFGLSGETGGARVVLTPRPDGCGAPICLGRPGLLGDVADENALTEAKPLAEGLELELRAGELFWRTSAGAGRAPLPAAALECLASGRTTGWRLSLEMPEGGGQAVTARIACRLSGEGLALLRESRARLGGEQHSRAMRIADPLLRAGDLARVARDYRDLGALSAMAEMDRARALLEAGRSAEARRAVEEFMATYPSQSALFPDARRLLGRIIGPER